jgi:hypothetical protein
MLQNITKIVGLGQILMIQWQPEVLLSWVISGLVEHLLAYEEDYCMD